MFITDIKQELKDAEDWDRKEGSISLIEIVDLAKTGIDTCEDFCASRKYCGEDRCYCIRARFESPQAYQLYKVSREYFLDFLAIGLIAEHGLNDKSVKEK